MAGDDLERFEDYQELDRFIEELRAGRIAHPPSGLTPEQAGVYRTVALFRAASAEEDQPRQAFAAALEARLQRELGHRSRAARTAFSARWPAEAARNVRPAVSRRTVMRGGATAAASLVVGAGLGATLEHLASQGAPTGQIATPLLPPGEGSWLAVAKLADLGENALRFATGTIVGYVLRGDGRDGEKTGVIAVSAACTHLGCIVQWESHDRKFHCPCHGGLFTTYGQPDTTWPHLPALPRLETRITRHASDEFIEVRVPVIPPTARGAVS
jgi:nitrite reductase/ring-hydroxylating ferredoxin subunit